MLPRLPQALPCAPLSPSSLTMARFALKMNGDWKLYATVDICTYIQVMYCSTANRVAQLVKHRTTVREVEGSNPGRTNTQGFFFVMTNLKDRAWSSWCAGLVFVLFHDSWAGWVG